MSSGTAHTAPAGSALRAAPQQARSRARVATILDAAARTFAEVGYDSATTNHIAAAADISVGSLYRWFPDKESIADELIRRYIETLAEAGGAAFMAAQSQPTPLLVGAVVRAIAGVWTAEPALAAIVAGGLGRLDSPAAPLRHSLVTQAEAVLSGRVPGLPDDERHAVATTCVAMLEGTLIETVNQPDRTDDLIDEVAYAVAAYLAMKYPFETSHRWSEPMPGLPPSRPSTA